MAFNFPDNPTLNQVVTGPTGAQYMWDGTKWVPAGASTAAFAPINSPAFTGNPTAPTQPLADSDTSLATTAFVRTGVTDGSNAAAGQVGEYRSAIVASTAPVGILANQWSQVTALTLPAGDWDVDGFVGNAGTGSTAGGMTAFGAAVSPTISPVNPADNTSVHFTYTNVTGAVIPTSLARLSLSATTPVYLCTYIGYTTGSANAYGLIRARRAR